MLTNKFIDKLIIACENCTGNFGTAYTEKYIIPALKEFQQLHKENEELKAVTAQDEMDFANIKSVLSDNEKTIDQLRKEIKNLKAIKQQ